MTIRRLEAPFGKWDSPISVDLLTGSAIAISDFQALGENDLYFLESRPFESGRSVLVKMDGEGKTIDVVGKSANVRTKVHEYGGCGFSVDTSSKRQGIVYSEFKDSRLYYIKDLKDISKPVPITPQDVPLRFASFQFHPSLPLLVAVCEDHTLNEPADVQNYLVIIDLNQSPEKSIKTIVRGSDFYSNPTFSPDGTKLAWKQWMHPEMPWTSSELMISDFSLDTRSISKVSKVSGASKATPSAVTQPRFTKDGTLIFVSDETGYSQLYRSESPYNSTSLLTEPVQGDFAPCDWTFGNKTYAIISKDKNHEIIAAHTSKDGLTLMSRIDLAKKTREIIKHPFLTISSIEANPAYPELVYIIGTTAKSGGMFSFFAQNQDLKVLKSTIPEGTQVDSSFLSLAQPLTIPLPQGRNTYGFYYPPTSGTHTGQAGKKPPLLVRIHGGPSGVAPPVTSLQISYWTSRGYAFFNSNYGGSSGFGRKYMASLNSNWGVVDLEDAIGAAEYLASHDFCDSKKMAIDGGSAGGYTVLNVMCHSTVFAAGCSLFGVSDLKALATDTHKFESQYLFNLVGGTPSEVPEVYHERSPLFHASGIKNPVMLQQGTEDKVVPINQAVKMVDVIKESGGTVELLVFEGEGHGFRGAKAQRESLVGETKFFEKYLDL